MAIEQSRKAQASLARPGLCPWVLKAERWAVNGECAFVHGHLDDVCSSQSQK